MSPLAEFIIGIAAIGLEIGIYRLLDDLDLLPERKEKK